jgi:hypothetical protein
LLISRDREFVSRVADVLESGERLICTAFAQDVTVMTRKGSMDLIALDARRATRDTIIESLGFMRRAIPDGAQLVAIVTPGEQAGFEVLARTSVRDLDVIIDNQEPVPLILRAMLNDASRTTAAAETLAFLQWGLRPRAAGVASAVLADGCRTSSVKQLARRESVSTDGIGKRLALEGSPPPKLVIRLARCCYAAVLLRRGAVKWNSIAKWAGYAKEATLRAHMKACLGPDLMALRWYRRGESVGAALEPRLRAWLQVNMVRPGRAHRRRGMPTDRPDDRQTDRQIERRAGRSQATASRRA